MTTELKPPEDPGSTPEFNVSAEGVDLTQIRALKAMTPTERLRALVIAANNCFRTAPMTRQAIGWADRRVRATLDLGTVTLWSVC